MKVCTKSINLLKYIKKETSLSKKAVHSSLLSSFYVIGREKVMAMMDEAEALGSQSIKNTNQFK